MIATTRTDTRAEASTRLAREKITDIAEAVRLIRQMVAYERDMDYLMRCEHAQECGLPKPERPAWPEDEFTPLLHDARKAQAIYNEECDLFLMRVIERMRAEGMPQFAHAFENNDYSGFAI